MRRSRRERGPRARGMPVRFVTCGRLGWVSTAAVRLPLGRVLLRDVRLPHDLGQSHVPGDSHGWGPRESGSSAVVGPRWNGWSWRARAGVELRARKPALGERDEVQEFACEIGRGAGRDPARLQDPRGGELRQGLE